jgi:hypothetical protein
MNNPYKQLPQTAFWRNAVADKNLFQIADLWRPKFKISRAHPVVTAGSCFAQHIGRALSKNGFHWLDAEPAPSFMPDDTRHKFNYGVFSFRTGNIYTAALLRQWLEWAFNKKQVSPEVWETGGRFYDPFRPAIEPDGFLSAEELLRSRAATLAAIRRAVETGRLFVFTMGLTESWENANGDIYPMCPGTHAGTFDQTLHIFKNYSYNRILADMRASFAIIREINPRMRILLTVSPVPLTATASNEHVLTATTYSKSTLRAVAGDLTAGHAVIDYFPSYEIVSGFPFRGIFFLPNMRNVASEGVDFVMGHFFKSLGVDSRGTRPASKQSPSIKQFEADVVCDEEVLDAQ